MRYNASTRPVCGAGFWGVQSSPQRTHRLSRSLLEKVCPMPLRSVLELIHAWYSQEAYQAAWETTNGSDYSKQPVLPLRIVVPASASREHYMSI